MQCLSCATELAPRATFCPNCGKRVEDPLLGTTLSERYRIDALIAVGGFGTVYRGVDLRKSRDIAVKVMHPELSKDPKLVARFIRESEVLRNLRDENTVRTYELDQGPDNRLFIVMELLEGDTLAAAMVAARTMPWRRIVAIVRQMCGALTEAHGLGVVHRDLKPANIYLEHGDRVKILDFGIAKTMQENSINDGAELTIMGQAVGTVEYMAPEQLMGGKCGPATDIYTVGTVMYEAITGRRPYQAAGLDLLTEQVSKTPIPPSQLAPIPVPPAVDEVVLRCLDSDVQRRYATADELAIALDGLLALPETVVEPPRPPLDLPKPLDLRDPRESFASRPRSPTSPSAPLSLATHAHTGAPRAWRPMAFVIVGIVLAGIAVVLKLVW